MHTSAAIAFACLVAVGVFHAAASAPYPPVVQDAYGETYHAITSSEELWRHAVSAKSEGRLNVGEDALCLHTSHNTFVRTTSSGQLKHDRTWCMSDERVEVSFLGGYVVAVNSVKFGVYLSCREDGALVTSPALQETEQFVLYIDEAEQKLGLYSVGSGTWVTASDDGRMRCGADQISRTEMFFGWKEGSKQAWTPVDIWEPVTEHRGYSQVHTPTASLNVSADLVMPGHDMSRIFAAGVVTRTDTDWTAVSEDTWTVELTTETSAKTNPPADATSYQAVGYYGVFKFYSDRVETTQASAQANPSWQGPAH